MSRAFVWIGGGVFVGALAFCTWWYLVPLGASRPFAGAGAVAVDAALFSAFALHHTLFARTGMKRAMAHLVADDRLRSVYVWVASVLLFIVCWCWRPIGGELYAVTGAGAAVLAAVQLAGVGLIAQSVRGLDPLELAGIRRETARNGLQITGPYHWVRHPLYLGWMLATFGHPHLTGDRLAFALISACYLVLAMPVEERSLVEVFGEDYRRYRQRVRWRVIPYVY